MNPEPNDQTNSTTTTNAPAVWPGAFGAYKYSRKAVLCNIWLLLAVYIIGTVVVVAFSNQRVGLPGQLTGDVIGAVMSVLIARIMIAGVRGRHVDIEDVFGGKLLQLSLKMFGLNIIIGLTVIVSITLLIIPFFFVYPRLVLANYFLVDKNMGVFEAYSASWAATRNNAGKPWGIVGVNLLMALLAITIIGIPFAIYFIFMYSAATAVLYEVLSHQHPQPQTA